MATPPTLVASIQTAWDTAATTRTSAALTTVVGDLLVVTALNENATATFGTPTATGVTFTSQQTAGVANTDGRAQQWTGVVGTAGAPTVTATNSVSERFGFMVHQFRAHGGVGAKNVSVNQTSLALTGLGDNSALVCGAVDFTAMDGTTRTRRTVNGATGTEVSYFRNSAVYTIYGWHHTDSGVGTTATVGMSAPSTGVRMTTTAVEVLGTGGGAAPYPFTLLMEPMNRK